MRNIDMNNTLWHNVTTVCSQPIADGKHRSIIRIFYETDGVTHELCLELDELPNGHVVAQAHRYDADGNYVNA